MLFYISFFILIFLLLELDISTRIKELKAVVFFLIFLLYALRFDVGYDYMYYYDILTKSISFYEAMFSRLEFFNRILINIAQLLHFPQFYFIATSLLLIYPLYLTIKNYSKHFSISTLLFLSFPIFFFQSLSIVRQYVAISLIFYSFKYIKSRVLWKFLIIVLIAFFFHYTAVIGVILYWIYGKKIESKYIFIIYSLSIFSFNISYYLVKYLFPQYLEYLDEHIGTGGDKILVFFQLIGFILLFFIGKSKNDNTNFYFISFFLGLFIWSSLNPYGHAGIRGGLYFLIFFILLIPELIIIIKQKKLIRQLLYLLCFTFFVTSLYLGTKNPHKDPNIPYRVYFLTDKNIYKIANDK